MKVLVMLLAAALVLGLFGCGPKTNPIEGLAEKEIVSFSFSHTASHTGGIYSYTVEKTDGGEHLLAELNAGYLTADVTVDTPLLQPLLDILVRWDVGAWNGFNESDDRVLDGDGFSLRVTFSDGTELYAHGSNASPDNYASVEREVLDLLQPIAEGAAVEQ